MSWTIHDIFSSMNDLELAQLNLGQVRDTPSDHKESLYEVELLILLDKKCIGLTQIMNFFSTGL